MLHLIPAPLHRQLYRLAHAVRLRLWRLGMPRRAAAFVLATDGEGRVLLVRHSYGHPVWALPGGGIGRDEDPQAAAVREFGEELGCAIENLRPLARTEEAADADDLRHVFVARLAGTPDPDGREIVEARLFAPDGLPPNLGRVTARRIAYWRERGG
jgi:8-oxo-dGTP pyrophosphatase MutT (NUDIX family)